MVPLGWLKKGQPTFVPPLPQRLQGAIENGSYSSLEKVYIAFPTAFWDRSPDGNAQEGFADPFLSFVHFLRPELVPERQKHWTIEMFSLSSRSMFGSHAKPTLLVYTHNPCAEHMLSLIRGLSPDSAENFDALNRFSRLYYSRLPNYQPGHADCTPTAILATDWHGDDLTGNGSSTNSQVSVGTGRPVANCDNAREIRGSGEEQEQQQIHLEDDIPAMRGGLPERRIWFAGEHTAPFVTLGTTTGAY